MAEFGGVGRVRVVAAESAGRFFSPKSHSPSPGWTEGSRSRAAVDILQADDVFLVELAEGDFQYSDGLIAFR